MTNNSNNGNSAGHLFDNAMSERYLFGELSEAEQERFENAYFADDEFFERFLAVKNDLLDLYARGELDAERRSRLEKTFRETEPRRKRIGESRDFIRAVSAISARESNEIIAGEAPAVIPSFFETVTRLFTIPRLATAALLLLAAVGGAWFLSRSTENTEQAAQQPPATNAEDANANQTAVLVPDNSNVNLTPKNDVKLSGSNTPPAQELAVNAVPDRSPITVPENVVPTPEPPKVAQNDPPQIEPPPVVPQPTPKPEIVAGNRTESVTLDGASRSATRRNTAEIGPATQSVSVRLLFRGPAYTSYSVRVATVGGRTVWQGRNLKAAMAEGAKSLTVSVPASSLSGKDYIVTLDARTPDGQTEIVREYYFHVDRP